MKYTNILYEVNIFFASICQKWKIQKIPPVVLKPEALRWYRTSIPTDVKPYTKNADALFLQNPNQLFLQQLHHYSSFLADNIHTTREDTLFSAVVYPSSFAWEYFFLLRACFFSHHHAKYAYTGDEFSESLLYTLVSEYHIPASVLDVFLEVVPKRKKAPETFLGWVCEAIEYDVSCHQNQTCDTLRDRFQYWNFFVSQYFLKNFLVFMESSRNDVAFIYIFSKKSRCFIAYVCEKILFLIKKIAYIWSTENIGITTLKIHRKHFLKVWCAKISLVWSSKKVLVKIET